MEAPTNEVTTFKSRATTKTWTKDTYTISTDPSLIPVDQLIDVFNSPALYWAKPMPEASMREMLQNSLNFGLYPVSTSNELLGYAHCITDFTTFLYLTDVWISPSHQGRGLGTWLMECVREVIDEMSYLRRSLLFTGDWERTVPLYERVMGMELVDTRRGEGLAVMERKGPGHHQYEGREGGTGIGEEEKRERGEETE